MDARERKVHHSLAAVNSGAAASFATYLGRIAGFYPEGHPAGFIASIIGAVVLLVIYHLVTRKQ
jgi:uncharacterized membrane protein YeaQ/YmgE (transglycosylase-associated protein family)